MRNLAQHSALPSVRRIWGSCLALALVCTLTTVATQSAQAQTFNVLHNFTGGQDGAEPYAGVTMDRAGNLYGTALGGGCGYGTAFKMTHQSGGWLFDPLYCFTGGNDGNAPVARVVFGPDGSLYGSTQFGGGDGCGDNGCGTVFNLKPLPTVCKTALCPWTETVLSRFAGGSDGNYPGYGDLTFDPAGDIYGTTTSGGSTGCGGNGCGLVFKLTPAGGGRWTESTVYTFTSGQDGAEPVGGVILDNAGNLYGTTFGAGAYGGGTVFELVPSGSGWTEVTLYSFDPSNGDGYSPAAGLIFDGSGNLYGTNVIGGALGGGTVFELTHQGGSWTETILYAFTSPGGGPSASVTLDSAGNLYGTTHASGAFGLGNVFELTNSNGSWAYSSLHDFTGASDGRAPVGNVILDAQGNVYGTASMGSSGCAPNGCGVVFEITP